MCHSYAHVLSCFVHVRLFVILRTVTHQAPLSMGCSRQKYWSGLPFPSLGDLPNPGIKLRSPHYRQILYHLSHQPASKMVTWWPKIITATFKTAWFTLGLD